MRTTIFLILAACCAVQTMFLNAGDTADCYLFRTMTLPVTEEIIRSGKLVLSVDRDSRDEVRKERTLVVRTAPGDAKITCILRDGIITSIRIKAPPHTVFKAEAEPSYESIFPTLPDGTWPAPVREAISGMLKCNIVSFIDRLKLKPGEFAALNVSNLSNGLAFAYELSSGSSASMKVFLSKDSFTIKYFASRQEYASVVFRAGNIRFINRAENQAFETDSDGKTIVVMKAVGDAAVYSQTGRLLGKPQFKLRIE